MIAAFDSLARQHAKEMDEAQDEIARLLLQNAELMATLRELHASAAHAYKHRPEEEDASPRFRRAMADLAVSLERTHAAIAKAEG